MQKAFTLIELLVVVLIIGILSAVALPQYQMSVAKAKFANMQILAHTYMRAAQEYYLSEGKWPENFDVLAVDAPGGMTVSDSSAYSNSCATNEQMYCCIMSEVSGWQLGGIVCGSQDYKLAFLLFWGSSTGRCSGKNDTVNARLCASIGKSQQTGGTNLPTPTGHKTGYTVYYM